MLRRHLLFAGLLGVAIAAAASGTARAGSICSKHVWLSGPCYSSYVPPCEAMLGDISMQFETKERRFWNSNLTILGYDNVREIAYRPWESGNIPRRFCTAQAKLSDGLIRTVNYSVIEDGGLASIGAGVEFCIIGLDRNWAFNPACKMARP